MRTLDLDLVRRRPAWPAWLLLVLGLALAVDVALGWRQAREQLAQAQQPVARPAPRRPAEPPLSEATRRELAAARQVLGQLAIPWEALFRSIEDADSAATALLTIEPDAARRSVRLSGEARDYPAILALAARLEAGGVLQRVHLQNHQLRDDAPGRPTQFTLSAHWAAAGAAPGATNRDEGAP
jgi:hypothetical protein